MSTFLLGALTAKREDAPRAVGAAAPGVAAAPAGAAAPAIPAVKPYVDALAALVPAEVLAISAAILPLFTEVSSDKKVTRITEPTVLKWSFVALLVLSVVIFLGSRFIAKNSDNKAPALWILGLQCLIPPVAFLLWSMLQPVSAFNVIDSGLSIAARETIAIIGSAFLGIGATALGYKLNKEDPTPKQ
jgi:hypothetical protein